MGAAGTGSHVLSTEHQAGRTTSLGLFLIIRRPLNEQSRGVMAKGVGVAVRVVTWSLITSFLVRRMVRMILGIFSSYAETWRMVAMLQRLEPIRSSTGGDMTSPWDDGYFWILHWKDYEPKMFTSFEKAREELLQELWFFSREFVDADPKLAEEIMAAWSDVLTWRDWQTIIEDGTEVCKREFSVEVAGFKYYLTRMDEFKEKYASH